MTDDADRVSGVSPWADGMRRLSEVAAQMTAAAQALTVSGPRATPPALFQPLVQYSEQLLAVSTAITDPMRRLLAEQERLVELMAGWAEQHRQLSEQVAEWAEQQGALSAQMGELARPFLDQLSVLEGLHADWNRRATDST